MTIQLWKGKNLGDLATLWRKFENLILNSLPNINPSVLWNGGQNFSIFISSIDGFPSLFLSTYSEVIMFPQSTVGRVIGMSWTVSLVSIKLIREKEETSQKTTKGKRSPSYLGWVGPCEETTHSSNLSLIYNTRAQTVYYQATRTNILM